MLATFDTDQAVVDALRAGASGFLLPGLFMGGTHDNATVADPMPL